MAIAIDVSRILYEDSIVFEEGMIKVPFTLLKSEAQEKHPMSGEIVGAEYDVLDTTIPVSIEMRNIDRILDDYNLNTSGPSPDILITFSKQWLTDNSVVVDEKDKMTFAGGIYVIYHLIDVDYTPTEPSVPLHVLAKARLERKGVVQ